MFCDNRNDCDILKSKMKIKMPCKLCELSLDHQKLGVNGDCRHSPFVLPQISPLTLGLGPTQMTSTSFFMPQFRDVVLAAYLFRGK